MLLRPALVPVVAAVLVGGCLAIGDAHAEPPKPAPTTTTTAAEVSAESRARAEDEFKKARALYLEGRYLEARTGLLEARKLDPSAKDLVFNLGIVAEKLLEYDEAIGYLREYKAMDSVTEAEAQRADTSIRRIEGARERNPKPTQTQNNPQPAPPPRAEAPKHGRIDALTVTGLGVTGAALATGIVFGVLALSANPKGTVETGSDNPFSKVDGDNSRAQTFGLVADIGFGVAVAGAVTTAVLYFARTVDARGGAKLADPSKTRTGLVASPSGLKVQF